MKTAISIPEETFREADALAKRLGMSRSELYVRAVRSYLDTQSRSRVTEKLNAIYEEEDSSLDPALMNLQTASLEQEEW